MDKELNPAFDLLTLTADIVSAHVANNSVTIADLPSLIAGVYGALAGLKAPRSAEEAAPQPAVSIRRSIRPDTIVCLEDGQQMKMLKRHLMTHHQMTPGDYRAKWNLPADYPMVAPNYAERRRALALKIGLGRKSAKSAPTPAIAPAKKPKTLRKKLSMFAPSE
ncbi:transcriptional regulator [Sphingobium indicum BiD32]|uniref:Transcriptional regulator n=1 Tax=Sphingobium indicum BiD32 TaxID=1301087 RepID=N1MHV2_9SPHN|nr:MucR family transcriptional regulator [Sphingobium indicum]CCW16536.1 transcriptional regulator [Sphingobium indicum BiD32]